MKQIRFDRIPTVVEWWISFTDGQNANDTSKRPEGIRRMFEREEIDGVIEFYGIPKIYKWEYDSSWLWKDNPQFSNILLDVENMGMEHQKIVDNYLFELWSRNQWEFFEAYSKREWIREANREKREKQEKEQMALFLKTKKMEEEEQRHKENLTEGKVQQMFNDFMINFFKNATNNPTNNPTNLWPTSQWINPPNDIASDDNGTKGWTVGETSTVLVKKPKPIKRTRKILRRPWKTIGRKN